MTAIAPVILEPPYAEDVLTIQSDLIRVDFVNIGEGLCGEYNADNPDDINMLRFDVYVKNDEKNWERVEDASYCTNIPADADLDILKERITTIYRRYADVIDSYPVSSSVKKLGEELSWLSD